MWAVLFVGSLCSFITPVFSSFSVTDESYIWLDSLDACNKINKNLASRQSVRSSRFLSPSETEAYWIQELEIIKMFPKDGTFEAYNESYRIKIKGENVQYQCTQTEKIKACTEANNDSSNLMRVDSFSTILGILSQKNTGYRIGYVNYTSLVNKEDPTTVITCVLYYQGGIFSDECSHKRRALCDEGEFQYDVSQHGGEFIPRYRLQLTSTIGVSTTIFNATSFHTGNNITTFKTPLPNQGITIDSATALPTIIGTVVSSVLLLTVIVLLLYCLITKRQRANLEREHKEEAYNELQKTEKEEYYSVINVYDEIRDVPNTYSNIQDKWMAEDKF